MLRCPTAAAPVDRGTHLARLAAGWPACAACEHRVDLTGAPPGLRRRLERRAPAPDPLAEPGPHGVIGGTAGGDFTPGVAADLAARFAATLPERAAVVLARDERPAHRAFAGPVAAALRTAGCDVRHLGEATDPAVRFAVRAAGAAGGLFLAAPDRPETHAGLIPIGPGGRPLTDEQRTTFAAAAPRVARTSGSDRPCGAGADYEASLWPAFRTLSARKVAVVCPSPLVRGRLDRLFAALPDELRTIDSPPRESWGDICLSIDSAGVRCRESAGSRPVPWAGTVRALAADAARTAGRGAAVAVPGDLADALRLKVAAAGGRVREVDPHPAALWDAVEDGAALAADGAGRAVFATPDGPAADGVLVLAALLRADAAGPGSSRRGGR